MISTLDKIRKTLEESYDSFRDGASAVIDKAEDFGKINKLKFEIRQLSVNVEKKLTVLGDAAYTHLVKNDIEALKNNPAIKLVVEEIQDFNTQIESKQKQIDEIISTSEQQFKSKEHGKMQEKIDILEKEIEERMRVLNELKQDPDQNQNEK